MILKIDTSKMKKAFDEFNRKVKIQADDQLRLIALDFYGKVKQKTPVWTGSLRASWQISRGSPNLNVKEIKELKSGGPRNPNFQLGKSYLPSLRPSKKMSPIYVTNNLPYAQVVEYGLYGQLGSVGQPHKYKVKGKWVTMIRTTSQGFSTQAPQGMVRISIINIANKYRNIP